MSMKNKQQPYRLRHKATGLYYSKGTLSEKGKVYYSGGNFLTYLGDDGCDILTIPYAGKTHMKYKEVLDKVGEVRGSGTIGGWNYLEIAVRADDFEKEYLYGAEKCAMNATDRQFLKDEIKNKECIGDVSDGYHTFNDLYDQRMYLFAVLVRTYKDRAWKTRRHDDGSVCFDGTWFLVGIDTPEGNYTYHYKNDYWDLFDCKEIPQAPLFDGHTDKDVTRLLSLPLDSITKKYYDSRISEYENRNIEVDNVMIYDIIARMFLMNNFPVQDLRIYGLNKDTHIIDKVSSCMFKTRETTIDDIVKFLLKTQEEFERENHEIHIDSLIKMVYIL